MNKDIKMRITLLGTLGTAFTKTGYYVFSSSNMTCSKKIVEVLCYGDKTRQTSCYFCKGWFFADDEIKQSYNPLVIIFCEYKK